MNRTALPLLALTAIASVALAGCGSKLPPPNTTAAKDECDAGAFVSYIGLSANKSVLAEIQRLRRDHPVRVIKPDTAVTMDFQADRLNIDVDRNDTITAFRCS